MKKFITLFTLVAVCLCSHAQIIESQLYNVQNEEIDRTDWYGFSQLTSVWITNSAAEYLLRVPEHTLEGLDRIEKVQFYHCTSENITNYSGEPFNNETYYIRFYTGTHYVATTYLDSNNVEHPYDSLVPGILACEFPYTPTETGWQVLHLPDTFDLPKTDPCGGNDEFCVSIFAPTKSAIGLCAPDTMCADLNYAYLNDNDGWWHYRFVDQGQIVHRPFTLIFYHQGDDFHRPSDWKAEIYNPNEEQADSEPVTEVFINSTEDSLFAYFGATCLFHYYHSFTDLFKLSLYADGETPFYFLNNQSYSYVDSNELGSFEEEINLRFTKTLCGMNELSNLNISFPFDLCFYFDIESLPENGCHYDINLQNNTYCVRYDFPNSIDENSSTLNVYPNPACNYIHIENAVGAQVSIYNAAGQEVMNFTASNSDETINVEKLPSGVYAIRVVNGNKVTTNKVCITR